MAHARFAFFTYFKTIILPGCNTFTQIFSMALTWKKGTVTRVFDETYDTRRFWIQVNEAESFDFKPGQFVTLDLPIHEQRNKRWRSYSISSAPNDSNTFELLIKRFELGAGSSFLFEEVKQGSELSFRGPQGVFILPEKIEKDIYFICTGTGVAPFKSMIDHLHHHHIERKNICLIYGCRTFRDTLYENDFRQLEKEMTGFAYLPVFSREPVTEGKRKGYVHEVYEELITSNGLSASFYLCGWKNMIDEARLRLKNRGVDKKDIHFELYG